MHLEDSEAALLELEENPACVESVARIFRAFHTIKGVAGFLEIDPISRIAHSAETLLDQFRQSEIPFGSTHADIVLEAKDMIACLLEALEGKPGPMVSVLEELIARTETMAMDPAAAMPLKARQDRAIEEHDSGSLSEGQLQQLSEGPKQQKLGTILIAQGVIDDSTLESALARQAASSGPHQRLGDILVAMGAARESEIEDALTLQGRTDALGQVLEHHTKGASDSSATVPTPPRKKVTAEATIRVNTQRLDALVDMVGELVIAQQMVVQDTERVARGEDERLTRNLGHLGKITRDLQEASMSLRMVTFRSTFQKMHRLVRDVAAKASKEVKLVIEGADTEVDRNVVDKISDPLVHLVRNAVDHGLETPDVRRAAGKSVRGTIVLSAKHQSGAIVISLQDDGGGLSRERIVQKALERGLLPEGSDPDELSDSAVHR